MNDRLSLDSTITGSMKALTMTILSTRSCHIICQKSFIVFGFGPDGEKETSVFVDMQLNYPS
jgi:hypothetical protein